MKIDSHQHYWLIERNDYGWLRPENTILYRDYTPEQLKPDLIATGIEKTVLVQAAPTIKETEFLLQLCEKYDTIAGVVGWMDLEADDFAEQFLRLRKNPFFVGIRPSIPDHEEWREDSRLLRSLRLLNEHDFPIDFLVGYRQLPAVLQLMQHVPKLRGVIDHLANPNISSGELDPWKTWIREMAQFQNIYCKLSGLATKADWNDWRYEQFIPYVHHAVNVFGTRRVMFGSDWPVCLQAGSYSRIYESLVSSLPDLNHEEYQAIFGGNAIGFYKLKLV